MFRITIPSRVFVQCGLFLAASAIANGCAATKNGELQYVDDSPWYLQDEPLAAIEPVSTFNVSSALEARPADTESPRAQVRNGHVAAIQLGAGDSLGQEVFLNFVALVRANGGPPFNWQIASGE
jgi:hypothetical protein